jgi:hypothetical protein
VHLELSGIPPLRLLEYFPRQAEVADRARWGTDRPGPGGHDLGRNLEQFLSLDLPDDVETRITVEHALQLFPST